MQCSILIIIIIHFSILHHINTVAMISNFQITSKSCKYHSLPQKYICLFSQCQYRAFLCSQCIKQNHQTHLHQIKSFPNFIDYFVTTVHNEQANFQRDKIIINVKDIIKTKKSQVQKSLNEVLISVVKILDKEKQMIFDRFNLIQQKYEQLESDYKKKLQLRFDCLQYLTSYKKNVQALEARLYCSSEWGIVNLKNVLTDLRTFSSNQSRNVNLITGQIISQTQSVLKQENNFTINLKSFISGYGTFNSLSPSKIQRPPLNKISKVEPNKQFLTANTRKSFFGDQQKGQFSGIGRHRINSLSAIRNNSPCDSESSKNRSMQVINKIPSLQNLCSNNNCNAINELNVKSGNNNSKKFLRLSRVIAYS